jgi:hypothetical protein
VSVLIRALAVGMINDLDGAMGDLSDGTVGRQSAHGGDRVNVTHARIDENNRLARERERARAGSLVDFKGGMERRREDRVVVV